MKKIISTLLMLFAVSIYGQKKKEVLKQVETLRNETDKSNFKLPTLEAIYDFKTQTYITDELKPKHKQPVVLKIININKFANIVEIFSNDIRIKDDFLDGDDKAVSTILKVDKPAEPIKFSALSNTITQVPKETQDDSDDATRGKKMDIENLNSEIVKSNKVILDNSNGIDTKLALIEEYENAKKTVTNDTDKIIKYDKTPIELDEKIKNLYTEIDSLKKNTKENEGIIKEKENKLFEINDNLKNFVYKTNKLAKEYVKIYSKLTNINKLNASYNSYIDFIINPDLNPDQYNENKLICTILRQDRRNDYYGYITDFDENHAYFLMKYNEIFNDDLFYKIATNDASYANLVKLKFDNIKTEVETIYNLVNLNELRKKLSNVEILDSVLSQKEAFMIVSDPIQPLEDYVEFKVQIKQNKELGNSIITQIPKKFTYIEYARGGVRWDFSVGTAFDFGIKNQEFEIQKISDTNFKIIVNNSSQYTPTIAGMLHTSFRSNSMYAFGFTLGASIDFTKLSLNSFFPGVSLLIGKREKIVFTVGPTFKKVNQIKSIYENNRELTATIPIEDITSEQFKIGWFFGMSYNLTSKQRGKFKLN
jgi:hypothetical protein